MSAPNAARCAELAYALANGSRVIPYVHGGTGLAGLDCRGFVLYVIRALGGTVRFAGATDLWQHYLTYRDTTAKAKASGRLVPGALLFHIENGVAEHVGWYTGIRGKEVAHASQSNGKVVLSPLSSYYNHAGWAKAVSYGGEAAGESAPPENASPRPGQAMVDTATGPLTLRKGPGTAHPPIAAMPRGTALTVLHYREDQPWARVRWDVRPGLYHIGWCAAEYLRTSREEA